MARPERRNPLRGILSQPVVRVPRILNDLLHAGIRTQDRLVRRRQLFTNIVAYVAALNAGTHFLTNAFYDFHGLATVNIYNGIMLVFCLLNHLLHRFGDLVAAVTLVLGIAVGHSFVVFAFGTESNLQFYFTFAGFALFLVGVENMRVFIALYVVGIIALLISLIFAPEYGYALAADEVLRHSLAFEAAMNAIVMNGLLITLALVALHRAEARSEALLLAMLPARIVERLKTAPDRRIADRVDKCSVLFIDLVGFTEVASRLKPEEVVAFLDEIFSGFDAACDRLGVDKIKTIGDSYMAAGGLAVDASEGARRIGRLALECLEIVETAPALGDTRMTIRAGIHSGPVTAGVIGDTRVSYDVWGDTVNTASRMESHGTPGRIHVSDDFRELAKPFFSFEPRGAIEVKSLGVRETFFLTGNRQI
ncbi:MAG: adenylate/guanylate cyclase domain-containing protein [Rhodobiaceae bacterium]|nr:adenylate/guanylate cyclase domain-containing protein [Rhodobiaceae bacterium]